VAEWTARAYGWLVSLTSWMDDNLATQGYRLSAGERRGLALGLRFPTALCLGLVTVGVVLQSALLLFALSAIGLVAGFTTRHPFDLLWNHAVRHVFRAPPVPPNPARRRHAFKVATVWLLVVATFFAVGWSTAGVVLGAMLLAACSAVTVFNLCLPSIALSLWERRRRRNVVAA
jgi:Domain of unknown function (DUF4395)